MIEHKTIYNRFFAIADEDLRQELERIGRDIGNQFRDIVVRHQANPHEVAEYLITTLINYRAEYCCSHAVRERREHRPWPAVDRHADQ